MLPKPGTKKNAPLILLFISLFFTVSCDNEGFKNPLATGKCDDAFVAQASAMFQKSDTVNKKGIGTVAKNLRAAYRATGFHPIWLNEKYHSKAAAATLLGELREMQWDGLDPERYHVGALAQLKIKLDTTKKNTLADAIAFDTAMTHSYLLAARDLLLGEIIPRKADSLWYHANDSSWDAPGLLAKADKAYPSLQQYRSLIPTYNLLRDEYERYYALMKDTELAAAIAAIHFTKKPDSALMGNINAVIRKELPWVVTAPNDTMSEQKQLLMAYQGYAGLRPTGKLDSTTTCALTTSPDTLLAKISANMERLRWMQRDPGDLYIIVDVPLMELFLRKDGVNAMHMRVVVGKPERQTPTLNATMANVVINPPWGVPPTILKNDVVPGFAKSGKQYLAKKGLKAYDKTGKVVRASLLNAHNLRRYTYKQAPGDDNSLGFVKFNLPNPWDIYLHDTPHRGDFVKRFRALSSGCIRLEHPQEMAIYILSELEHMKFDQDKMDAMIATHKTKWEILKTKIPVHIAYLTAFEDTTGKHIQFVNDVYQRDEKLISLLGKK